MLLVDALPCHRIKCSFARTKAPGCPLLYERHRQLIVVYVAHRVFDWDLYYCCS